MCNYPEPRVEVSYGKAQQKQRNPFIPDGSPSVARRSSPPPAATSDTPNQCPDLE